MANSDTIRLAWEEVKWILQNDTTLKKYVKEVYEGDRENIPRSAYPCIIMEDGGEEEFPHTTTNRTRMVFTIQLILGILIRSPEKQMVGDTYRKGILDFSIEVRNALEAYPQLNALGTKRCIKFEFPTVEVGNILDTWPYRFRRINMAITILANEASR